MPPKKRQKREHPHVGRWTTLSSLAKEIATSTKQQHQYIALLMQISELTQHDSNTPDNPWGGDQVDFQDVRDYVLSWLDDFDENIKTTIQIRQTALDTLKKMENDKDLTSAAAMLTEASFNLKTLESFIGRWERIVRYKNKKISIREHTDTWLTRWLRQWEVTNTNKTQLVQQFRETLVFLSRDSPSPVLTT